MYIHFYIYIYYIPAGAPAPFASPGPDAAADRNRISRYIPVGVWLTSLSIYLSIYLSILQIYLLVRPRLLHRLVLTPLPIDRDR